MFQESFQAITNFVIRPQRQTYENQDLGNRVFSLQNVVYTRHDLDIPYFLHSQKLGNTSIKNIIKCSFIQRNKRAKQKRICVVYLHGNIGNRLSSFAYIENVLKMQLQMACFDFLGCGNSDGDYITMGEEEKYQIQAVLTKLKNSFNIDKFILYGSSMGASSAVLYCQHFNCKNVIGLILDSPYTIMNLMFKQIANKKMFFIPQFLIEKAMAQIDGKIQENIGYSVTSINLLKGIQKIKVPVYIMYGNQDEIISKKQVLSLFAGLKGHKKLQFIQGQGHNDKRTDEDREHALKWILDFQL